MSTSMDFLQLLETDMALNIFMCLDDPADLVRAASVSRFWRHFAITNGLFKQLCLRLFPQFSRVAHITESSCVIEKSVDVGPSSSMEWEILEREHKVYSFLVRALKTIEVINCIAEPISASSTDDYPRESILNTLDPQEIQRRASYWSSKGQSNPEVAETLIYKLRTDLCVITEINVHPFQAYFQYGDPIYSAKSVRFRMGHLKYPKDAEKDLVDLPLLQPADDKFVWSYTSQEFPMAQENRLQSFKLPEHALCVGGYIQIELLGRVQRQATDHLFYICVAHVQVLGRPFPFDVEILEPSGKFSLKYCHEAQFRSLSSFRTSPVLPALLPHDLAQENFEQAWNNDFDDEWDEDNDFDEALIL